MARGRERGAGRRATRSVRRDRVCAASARLRGSRRARSPGRGAGPRGGRGGGNVARALRNPVCAAVGPSRGSRRPRGRGSSAGRVYSAGAGLWRESLRAAPARPRRSRSATLLPLRRVAPAPPRRSRSAARFPLRRAVPDEREASGGVPGRAPGAATVQAACRPGGSRAVHRPAAVLSRHGAPPAAVPGVVLRLPRCAARARERATRPPAGHPAGEWRRGSRRGWRRRRGSRRRRTRRRRGRR